MEYRVILHTANGDVVTAYPSNMAEAAIEQFRAYVSAGHRCSIEYK